MKKKIVSLLIVSCIILSSAIGCGSKTETHSKDNSANNQTKQTVDASKESEPAEENNKDFDGSGMSELGNGTFYISTPGGTSEDGNVPVFLDMGSTMMTEVGYCARGIDGTHLTYFYIDGMENDKGQVADTDGSLIITDDALDTGVHTVEAVQFDTDDSTGTVIAYKYASYEVK